MGSNLIPVGVDRSVSAVQRTYGAFIGHAVECQGCRETGARCDTAERLWRKYKEARSQMA